MKKTSVYTRRWQLRMRAAGLCTKCGRPAVTAQYCEKHAAAHADSQRRRYFRKRGRRPPAVKAATGRKPIARGGPRGNGQGVMV